MSTKSELLKMLSESDGYVSGEAAGEALGVTRASISKACQALRDEGYEIESRTNNGYKLKNRRSLLTFDEISSYVTTDCELIVNDVVKSTNDLAKEEPVGSVPKVFIADKQEAGRGRLGRRFESPAGTGLYMSISMRPGFDISRSLFVTMAAAVGTARAIEKVTGKHALIKWVNDLYLDGKKICGILTEAQSDFEMGGIDKLVVGIGVNCFPGSFPEELKDIAGSISGEDSSFSRSRLAAEMINEVLPLISRPDISSFISEYRGRCFILGMDILVKATYDSEGVPAKALSVEEDGGLRVKFLKGEKDGKEEVLRTGEVSIKVAE